MLLLLHSTFMLSVVKMLLKEEVGGCALNSHRNYIVDHGKSWNYVFEFLWKPCPLELKLNMVYLSLLYQETYAKLSFTPTRVPTGQGNLIFLQGQGKVRGFCKMVGEIRKSIIVREKSGNIKKYSFKPLKNLTNRYEMMTVCQFLDGYYAIQPL